MDAMFNSSNQKTLLEGNNVVEVFFFPVWFYVKAVGCFAVGVCLRRQFEA